MTLWSLCVCVCGCVMGGCVGGYFSSMGSKTRYGRIPIEYEDYIYMAWGVGGYFSSMVSKTRYSTTSTGSSSWPFFLRYFFFAALARALSLFVI